MVEKQESSALKIERFAVMVSVTDNATGDTIDDVFMCDASLTVEQRLRGIADELELRAEERGE